MFSKPEDANEPTHEEQITLDKVVSLTPDEQALLLSLFRKAAVRRRSQRSIARAIEQIVKVLDELSLF